MFFCLFVQLLAQHSFLSTPFPRSEALGGCRAALAGSESVWGNPAGLTPSALNPYLLVAARQAYGLEGLEQLRIAGTATLGGTAFGVSLGQFGSVGYREQEFSLTVARALSPTLEVGVRLGCLRSGADETGLRTGLTSALGIRVRLDEWWQVSSMISQPWMDRIPGGWQAGFGFTPSKSTLLVAELAAEWGYAPTFRTGAEYSLDEAFVFRAGIQLSPSVFTLGMGMTPSPGLRLDASAAYDLLLGLTPGVALSWQLPDR